MLERKRRKLKPLYSGDDILKWFIFFGKQSGSSSEVKHRVTTCLNISKYIAGEEWAGETNICTQQNVDKNFYSHFMCNEKKKKKGERKQPKKQSTDEWINKCYTTIQHRLPQGLSGKESACSSRDTGTIPGWGDSLEDSMATNSNILAWIIPWTKEAGGLQSVGSQRIGLDWSDWAQHTRQCNAYYFQRETKKMKYWNVLQHRRTLKILCEV